MEGRRLATAEHWCYECHANPHANGTTTAASAPKKKYDEISHPATPPGKGGSKIRQTALRIFMGELK